MSALDAQLINLKRSGKENVTHKPAIDEEHLKQLKAREVYSFSSPLCILRSVGFHIVLSFTEEAYRLVDLQLL